MVEGLVVVLRIDLGQSNLSGIVRGLGAKRMETWCCLPSWKEASMLS